MTVAEFIAELQKLPESSLGKEIAFEGKLKFLNPETREVKEVQKLGTDLLVVDEVGEYVYVTYR